MSRTHIATIKEYFKFSLAEFRSLLLVALIFGFIISFRHWGGAEFSATVGIINFFNSFIAVLFCLVLQVSIQKIVGLRFGFEVVFKPWLLGLMVGLIATFGSFGFLWIFLPGGIVAKHLSGIRLGRFRYGANLLPVGIVAYSGSLGILIVGIILRYFSILLNNPLLNQMYFFSLLLAIYTLVPIPPLNGFHLYFASREVYVFMTIFLITLALLLHIIPAFIAIFVALITGSLAWVYYFKKHC